MSFADGQRCGICGDKIPVEKWGTICLLTGKPRCDKPECLGKAEEYSVKKIRIMNAFALSKDLALRPIKEKLEMDLFLLDRDYLFHE